MSELQNHDSLQSMDELGRRLRRQDAILKAKLETSNDGILVADENGQISLVNSRFLELWGISASAVDGASLAQTWDLIADKIREPEQARGMMGDLSGVSHGELALFDGKHYAWHSAPIFSETGECFGRLWRHVDDTERQRSQARTEEQRLQAFLAKAESEGRKSELDRLNARLAEAQRKIDELATVDPLTGLRNHRAFRERFTEEFERARRYCSPLSIVLLDIDEFKNYNDFYGHVQGDAALKAIAQEVRSAIRSSDIAARYGGEEFALILPETPADQAVAIAERLRAVMESMALDHRGVTCSFGIATITPALTSPTELIAQADVALYRSKERGRNRVSHYGVGMSAPALYLRHA